MLHLGCAQAGTAATLYGLLPTFVDGTGTPAAIGGTTAVVTDCQGNFLGSGADTPTLTPVATIDGVAVNGVYYLTVPILDLAAGTYFVVITSGSFGTPAISLVGQVIATFTVTANGLPKVYADNLPDDYLSNTEQTQLSSLPTAVLEVLINSGILQVVPGASSSSGQSEPTLQFTAQALAPASGGTAVDISTDTIIIRSNN